ncbi:MAG TPA: sugar phosphate isomerase/epimerase [Candidatus Dormibacteraeota bacterium]|nr:sugar phosphate isomerase/epimerase [Candidatus Dormibacteraeota bacterium]
MTFRTSRRGFLVGAGALAAGTAVLPSSVKALLVPDPGGPRYDPMDLSYFDTPISPAPSDIRLGYASITWNGNDRQAIADIAALGFPGIQLRSNILKEFSGPSEVRELLEEKHLKMVALSSGGVSIDPAVEAEEIAKHTANAKYVHDVGGLYLQVTDQRPKGREVTPADHKRLGHMLTEIGKRTADLGIPLGYHNHMGSLGERPEEVDRILEAADPRYAKLELDVAHYFQGGGDPVKAIQKYHDRLLFLHLKDVEPKPGDDAKTDAKRSYRFVELGRGRVNLPAVMDSLHKFNFRGWAVVELDVVPDKTRTPKESAEISKKYLQERLGQTV